MSFDIKFTRFGSNRSASLAIQQVFSKPCLVNLISKETHQVFSIYLTLANKVDPDQAALTNAA